MVTPFLKQAWVVSAVLSNMVGQGMLLSYTTSLLPALQDPESSIKADLDTASWLASSVGLAGVPGFLLSSVIMEVYGRKRSHALVVIPGIVGWALIYFATNIPMLMAGRILGGVTAGATVSLGAIVIGEFSSPGNRGMFLNLKTAAVSIGGTSVHILGHYYQWRTIALIALMPHVVSLLIIFTWPESPAWLASRQEFERSEKAFYWLRGKNEESYRELEELITAQMERASKNVEATFCDNVKEFFKKFTRKDFLKPLFIVIVSMFLLEMCGRHIFPAYALQIIGDISGNVSHTFVYTLCIDMIITVSAIFSSALVKIMKRRTLLFSTGFAGFIILLSVCLYLFLASRNIISKDRSWIPIGMFVVYFILVNLGCTPIPLALLGELFPLAHRGAGSAIAGVVISLNVMLGLQLTPYLLVSIKVYGTFAVFGSIMGLSLVILYFTLPETKDRTLQEIEDYFNNGKFKKRVDNDVEVKKKMIT